MFKIRHGTFKESNISTYKTNLRAWIDDWKYVTGDKLPSIQGNLKIINTHTAGGGRASVEVTYVRFEVNSKSFTIEQKDLGNLIVLSDMCRCRWYHYLLVYFAFI